MGVFLFLFAIFGATQAQNGPGRGPWTVSDPANHGLSRAALDTAEAQTNSGIGGRTCFLVIKNGEIVYERYRGNGGTNVRSAAWSVTKSFCSSLYGIAVEQGWANVRDQIRNRNSGTRQCNNAAEFRHALTMTGTSSNLNNPRFSYDTLGTNCLDTITDFIGQNNADRTGSEAWKNKFWHDVLGMEGMRWSGIGSNVGCGFGAETSCRDMARAAQLFLNDGQWPGEGQVMNADYTRTSRTAIFPNSGSNYGYTVWRTGADSIDPNVSRMDGMFTQCAIMSKVHEVTVITMGQNTLGRGSCGTAWSATRNAIVSKDVAHLYNFTISAEQQAIEQQQLKAEEVAHHQEIREMGEYMLAHLDQFSEEQISTYYDYMKNAQQQ